MKLYKYRDLSTSGDAEFQRLSDILHRNAFWCARPSTLNDPAEFHWDCNYEPTGATIPLLTKALIQFRNRDPIEAHAMATAAVSNRRVEVFAKPAFAEMIERCRNEMGLACFGTTYDNPIMWQRYGGHGAGVCIEVEAPSEVLNKQLFPVEYPPAKVLHIDQLLAACVDPSQAKTVHSVALLSKSPSWAPESEVRFISRKQNVTVQISGSVVSRIILGPNLEHHTRLRILGVIESRVLRWRREAVLRGEDSWSFGSRNRTSGYAQSLSFLHLLRA